MELNILKKGNKKIELEYQNELYNLSIGETLLLPASINEVDINAKKAEILEIYL